MSYNIQTTATFKKDLKRLSKRFRSLHDDILSFIKELQANPFLGTDLGDGVHKVRVAITNKGRGKSGGARIITYTNVLVDIEEGDIYLLTMYDKADQDTIFGKQIQLLIQEDFNQ